MPRSWAPEFKRKFLVRTTTGKQPVKALKAHEARVAIEGGFFAVVANAPGPTIEEQRRRKPFAIIQGNLAECTRQLYSNTVHMHDYMDRLEELMKETIDLLEKHGSYYMNSITTHLLRHLPAQLACHGPMVEFSMFPFESALGANKNTLNMNKWKIVSSMVNSWLRVRMTAMMGSVLRLEHRGEMHARDTMRFELLPSRKARVIGDGQEYNLLQSEVHWLGEWAIQNHPECVRFFHAYKEYQDGLKREIRVWQQRKRKVTPHITHIRREVKRSPRDEPERWLGRNPTPREIEDFLGDCPRISSIRKHDRCAIGRDEFATKRSHGKRAACHHWGLKLAGVVGGDANTGVVTKVDYYGELRKILRVNFAALYPSRERRSYTLFLGNWYKDTDITYDAIAKVVHIKKPMDSRGGTWSNAEPIVDADVVSPMVYIGPHPYRDDVWVVYDRHADFLHRATHGYAPVEADGVEETEEDDEAEQSDERLEGDDDDTDQEEEGEADIEEDVSSDSGDSDI